VITRSYRIHHRREAGKRALPLIEPEKLRARTPRVEKELPKIQLATRNNGYRIAEELSATISHIIPLVLISGNPYLQLSCSL
jgi:hypothetical protein